MRLGASSVLILPLFLLAGCERGEVRSARQAVLLIRTMGDEVRSSGREAEALFSGRADFEDLRQGFGTDRLDAGTPLGPDFQTSIATMLRTLETEVEKETKDGLFLRKAVRRVRHFHQWWMFARQKLEARLGQLSKTPRDTQAQRLLGGRVRLVDTQTVLSETIRVIRIFEASALRCVRGIEALITQS
jgi:hypothetical protein